MKPSEHSKRKQVLIGVLFLSATLLCQFWVVLFNVRELSAASNRSLGIISALCLGFAARFISGGLGLDISYVIDAKKRIRIRGTDGMAIIVIVLAYWFWGSEYSPTSKQLTEVRVSFQEAVDLALKEFSSFSNQISSNNALDGNQRLSAIQNAYLQSSNALAQIERSNITKAERDYVSKVQEKLKVELSKTAGPNRREIPSAEKLPAPDITISKNVLLPKSLKLSHWKSMEAKAQRFKQSVQEAYGTQSVDIELWAIDDKEKKPEWERMTGPFGVELVLVGDVPDQAVTNLCTLLKRLLPSNPVSVFPLRTGFSTGEPDGQVDCVKLHLPNDFK